jgi:type IV secretion/conjugal transfer VirB4 family ATPase
VLSLREYKQNPDRLSDLLPWAALVAKGIVLNKDGSFLTTFSFRGQDLDSSTESELITIAARLNHILKRLGTGWAIFCEASRRASSGYPDSIFPDPITALIDEERRVLFEANSHFESEYFLTFQFLPQSDGEHKILSTFISSDDEKEGDYSKLLESFQAETGRFLNLLSNIFPEVRALSDDELLTYLHSAISTKNHKVVRPEVPMYLDAVLSDSRLLTGFEPKLDDKFLKVISIKGFPGKSQPGLLDRLNRLPIQYRWMTRFIPLDKADAEKELTQYKRRWFAKRKSVTTMLKEMVTSSESIMSDSDAVSKAHDADEALQEVSDDLVSYGYFTTTLVLMSENKEALQAETREIERLINGLGFTTILEDVNAVDAWLGTIPGNTRNNVRRPLLNTLNLAHLIPVSAVWAGPETNKHLKGPPLLFGRTNGSTQFRLSLHVGDVGHTLILGPTGSGKSVFLNLIEAQFRRYKDAQVYIFDKGGSARLLTMGVGGNYFDIGADEKGLSFQPLSKIDDEAEKTWAQDWILALLEQENVQITPNIKEEVWTAINSLSTAPERERTIFGLSVLLQNYELRSALMPYTMDGPYGRLLDHTVDNLSYGSWQCFEMESIMETPQAVLPVLSYLFHRLESRFDGRPTMLVLDEAWLFLDNKSFSAKIREWLKVLRKANVMVVFATQSLSDVDASSISSTIKEACFTKIYLPNPNALNVDAHAFYKKFGLNEKQIQILATATPKRDYYYTSPQGNRLFELGLDEVQLSYCAQTSKEAQAASVKLFEEAKSTEEFNKKYLRGRSIMWAADEIENLGKQNRRAA